MSQPKVSVIIPVYNTEDYLRECLDSVVNQTLKDIEIICVDDGSTDNSLAILREYEAKDSRVIVLTQENQFAGVARNHGMEAACGQYYAFMDADDCFLPDAIEKMFNLCEQYELDFIKACFYNLEPGKKPYDNKYSLNGYVNKNAFHKILSFPEDISALNYIVDVPWNGLYRASFLKEYGIAFNHFRVINDHSFFVNCIIHARRAMVTEDHVAYHRINQMSSLVGTKQKYYQCQIDNYDLVRQIVQAVEWAQRRQLLQRELDGVLHWYSRLYPTADSFYKEQLDSQLRTFITGFNEGDVGIQHLLTMHHRELYYRVKSELLESQIDPVFPCKVSIIIPVYNTERYLDECLTSICNQTYQNIEIICIDDKSTDSSLAILERWAEKDSRIKVIAQKENTHQGGARNAGLDIARGKYVWFVDSDDVIDTDAVEFLVNQMEQLSDVDLITFNADAFQEINGKKRQAAIGVITRKWPKNRRLYLPQNADTIPASIDGSCVTFFSKRDFIDSYRFRPHIFYEDACFTFSALTAPGVFYELEYSPYHRRIREGSSTGQDKGLSEKCLKDRIVALQDISAVINERKLPSDHFGVRWFRKWAQYSIRQYWARGLRDPNTDSIILHLQMECHLYDDPIPVELLKSFTQEPLIVSLTSYPARIHCVFRVIESMKNQTVSADKIILWLAEEQFPAGMESLPADLLSAVDDIFEIRWCQDLKPHKKYYSAMLEYPEAIIITVDDDVYYQQDTIEKLLRSYLKFPYAVSAMCANLITFDMKGNVASYYEFAKQKKTVGVPSYCLLAIGVGGILYPPHCMHNELFNEATIKTLCLYADDLWLKVMQILNGTPVVIASDHVSLRYIGDTQENALWKSNLTDNKNDEQLVRILEKYDRFLGEKDTITHRIWLSYLSFEDIQPHTSKHNNRRGLNRGGRFITIVPGKIRGGIQCYRDHGARYTFRRTLYHMGLWKDKRAPKASQNGLKLILRAESFIKGKQGKNTG